MPAQNGSQVNESRTAQEEGRKRSLLRELKGAPLSVFIALKAYGPQGIAELTEHTGWSENLVADALAHLVKLRLVTRLHYRSWALQSEASVNAILTDAAPNADESETSSSEVSRSETAVGEVSAETAPGEVSVVKTARREASDAETARYEVSAPHDHDGVIDTKEHSNKNKHHPSKTTMTTLARALKALDPPFENARLWLKEASPRLVQGWLDYLQNLDRESRRLIRNEAAFLRWKVDSEAEPPPAPKERAPCQRCNKAIRDAEGRCLVCLGLVAV